MLYSGASAIKNWWLAQAQVTYLDVSTCVRKYHQLEERILQQNGFVRCEFEQWLMLFSEYAEIASALPNRSVRVARALNMNAHHY